MRCSVSSYSPVNVGSRTPLLIEVVALTPPFAVLLLLPFTCRMIGGDEFIKRVVPTLSRLFASSDRGLRRNLLEAIDTFGPHLTQVCTSTRGGLLL
jgi:SCY1-like protein 1